MAGTAQITGHYPLAVPMPHDNCPGCPPGNKGWYTIDGERYCAMHFDEVMRHPDEWQAYGDEYTGPTYMEYDEERW